MRASEIFLEGKKRRKRKKKTVLQRGVYGWVGYPLDGDGGGDGGMSESVDPQRLISPQSFGSDPYGQIMADHVRELLTYFVERGYKGDFGRERYTFFRPSNPRIVYKVPLNLEGIRANTREAEAFKKDDHIKVARCRVVYPNKDIGIPVLAMEFVTPTTDELPWWSDFVDCQQVGKNHRGNIVAYDL